MQRTPMFRLSTMMFLEFFIWGAWLPKIFGYLPAVGFNNNQSWLIISMFNFAAITAMFFSTQFADRNFAAEKFLAFSHFVGGLAMLIGIVMIGVNAGTFSIAAILSDPALLGTGPVAVAAILLLLVGAVTKSAQIPFHFWLPGAMAAPTPVSAYLHAAAMVKAGVYLVALLAPVFADLKFQPVYVPSGA